MDEFTRSLDKVLVVEGGFTNNPKDPGGATNKGITQRVYNEYRQSKTLDVQSVQKISDAEVAEIYRERYWDEAKCDKLRSGVSYVLFDGSVNSGVSQAVKWLQRALKQLGLYQGAIDGIIGQGTILAAGGVNDDDGLISIIMDRRLAFLKALKTWKYFGKGWASRCAVVLATGQAWASGSVGPEFGFVDGGQAKAYISDAKSAPVLAVADGTSGSGLMGGGVTAYIASAKDQLSQYAGASAIIDHALMWMTVGSVALVGGGMAYRWYAKRMHSQLADALDLPTAPQTAQAAAA